MHSRGMVSVEHETGEPVCERCLLADTFWTRFRGLMGRKELAEDEGLLLRPGGSVHTFFMRFPIDVVFLDREDVVVKVVSGLQPWRLASGRRARRTLELPSGAASRARVEPGQRLVLVPRTS